ncbi:MAG: cytochrome c peroxidase [bacterium]|nr:cytochrome c peroxidase [bacterium]
MSHSLWRNRASMLLVGSLLACEAPRTIPQATAPTSDAPSGTSESTPRGDGASVTFSVRWPARTQSTLPSQMERVLFTMRTEGGQVLPYRLDFRRTQFPVATSGTLSDLPSGTFVFVVHIEDGTGRKIAGGAVTKTLARNEKAGLAIPVFPSDQPRILEVSPLIVGPGGNVNVLGEALGLRAGFPLRVYLGDQEVPADHVTRLSEYEVKVRVPDGARDGKITLRVGRTVLPDHRTVRLIDRIQLRLLESVPFSPGGSFDVAWEVRAQDGTVLENTNLDWNCEGCDMLADVVPRGNYAVVKAPESPRSLKVSLSAGKIRGELDLTTTAFGRSTLPAGLGRLDQAIATRAIPVGPVVALGESLFHDAGLSQGGVMSCATCHIDSLNHADGRRLPLDRDGKPLKRNTPSLTDTGFGSSWFWDGRSSSLEEQARDVFANAREFASATASVESYLRGSAPYVQAFDAAFQASPSFERALSAIAAYERTLVTPVERTPYLRWVKGEDAALTPSQRRGLALFVGRAHCVACHAGPTWSDGKFHNIVVPGSGTVDPGRIAVTGQDSDWGAFKTTPLWSVARTAPYFHDGSQATLNGAVLHYTKFDPGTRNQSAQLRQVPLLPDDLTDLERFLEALTPTDP